MCAPQKLRPWEDPRSTSPPRRHGTFASPGPRPLRKFFRPPRPCSRSIHIIHGSPPIIMEPARAAGAGGLRRGRPPAPLFLPLPGPAGVLPTRDLPVLPASSGAVRGLPGPQICPQRPFFAPPTLPNSLFPGKWGLREGNLHHHVHHFSEIKDVHHSARPAVSLGRKPTEMEGTGRPRRGPRNYGRRRGGLSSPGGPRGAADWSRPAVIVAVRGAPGNGSGRPGNGSGSPGNGSGRPPAWARNE